MELRRYASAITPVIDSPVLTFGGLAELSARGAALLLRSGLTLGDRVGVILPMSPELYVVALALFRLGLVPVLFDPRASSDEIAHGCERTEPHAWIIGGGRIGATLLGTSLGEPRRVFSVGFEAAGAVPWSRLQHYERHDEIVETDSTMPALVSFTSGSAGQPKSAVRTHGMLKAQHAALERSLSLADTALDLNTLPVFVLANLGSGVTTLIPGAFRDQGATFGAQILATINAYQPTRITTSPAFLDYLAEYCLELNVEISNLRRILNSSS